MTMDEGARKWLIKTARKNHWRVMRWYDLEDLISDGLMCWQIVVRRYTRVRERKHIMALFQRTYINHIHRLANKRTRQAMELVTDRLPDEVSCPDAELLQFACTAPADVRALLFAIIDRPEILARPHRRRLDGRRETTNSWLCALAGLDPDKHNVDSQLRALLKA